MNETHRVTVRIKEQDFQVDQMKIGQFARYLYEDEELILLRNYDGWVAINNPRKTWRSPNSPSGIGQLIPDKSIITIEV